MLAGDVEKLNIGKNTAEYQFVIGEAGLDMQLETTFTKLYAGDSASRKTNRRKDEEVQLMPVRLRQVYIDPTNRL